MYLTISNKVTEYLKNNSENNVWIYDWEDSQIVDSGVVKTLGKFDRINFFVGANNCGKSRFLRGLIKTDKSDLEIHDKTKIETILNEISSVLPDVINNSGGYSITNKDQSIIKGLTRGENRYLDLSSNYNNTKGFFEEIGLELIKVENELLKINLAKYKLAELRNKRKLFQNLVNLDNELQFVVKNKPHKRKYIPILRSLQKNPYLAEESFKETVKKQFGIERDIYTGLDQYDINLKIKNSTGRKKIIRFENFLSKHFFNGKTIEITSDIESKDLLFAIDGVDLPIYDIGDGIQALIILLFPVFTADDNDWFFIEEPETHLHPGLQRLFIETLLNDEYLNSKKLRYFFTTHSNHFLDMTLSSDDISIFQFQKDEESNFFIKNNIKPDNEILELLGVNSSSVFLANTSIWVEGPTDRKYLSKMLRLYAEHKGESLLKEDIDFAFFEYGGNLISHYLFEDENEVNESEVREKINSFALSNKIYLLADNDNAELGSAKFKRRIVFEEISEVKENFLYQNTKVTEIENLLPEIVVKQFMKFLISDEQKKDKATRIRFTRDSYSNVRLGEFYNQILKGKVAKKNIRNFAAESGTLKNEYKIKLANFFINSNYTYSEIVKDNEPLRVVVENLYSFVKRK